MQILHRCETWNNFNFILINLKEILDKVKWLRKYSFTFYGSIWLRPSQ